MNMLVAATTLHSLLRRDGAAGSSFVRADALAPADDAAADWGADTRPVIFRSEAFAEDLDELLAA